MLKHYVKIAFRNIGRNSTFSFLNIFGLALGTACAILIFLWAEDEISYDSFNQKANVLYQVYQNQTSEGKTFTINATPGPLAKGMKEEIPGIKNTCRTTWSQALTFSTGDKKMEQQGLYADAAIFKMFTLPFVEGNPNEVFSQTHSLVLTQGTARRLFGATANCVGKSVKAGEADFIVTGVIKDLPENSTLQFDWLAPFALHFQNNQWLDHWEYNGVQTFVELSEGANPAATNQRLSGYTMQKTTKRIGKPFLLSMNDWRLRSSFEDGKPAGGRIQYVKLFSIIACIILLIACINFMNLATARSARRAKEVGIRKAVGAEKSGLISQFMLETVLMSLAALLIAVLFVSALLPLFNTLVQKHLALHLLKPEHLFSLLGIAVGCGVLAGSYPSFYLSSFNPVLALKGVKTKDGGALFVRKGLVIVQFAASVIFIVGTIVVFQQIRHVKNRPLGYDKNNLLQVALTEGMKKNYAALRQDLLARGGVSGTAQSMLNVLFMGSTTSDFSWQSKSPNEQVILTQNWVDDGYIPTTGMQIRQGRNFYPNAKQDSLSVIVNESLARLIDQNGNAVGKILTRGKKAFTVVGITADVIYGNLYSSGSPMIFLCYPEIYNYLYLRLPSAGLEQSVANVQAIVKKYNPDYSGDYSFVDTEFNQLFESEMLTGKLSRIFAVIAIVISCLGLLGMAAYAAETRTKEIGIRKVLGATAFTIVSMLSKDLLRLVLAASIVAGPVGWWIMNKWLQDYAYRITLTWTVFPLAGLAVLTIAFATISFQAIKAALANPVKSLKTE